MINFQSGRFSVNVMIRAALPINPILNLQKEAAVRPSTAPRNKYTASFVLLSSLRSPLFFSFCLHPGLNETLF
jgi:hypothetical protein